MLALQGQGGHQPSFPLVQRAPCYLQAVVLPAPMQPQKSVLRPGWPQLPEPRDSSFMTSLSLHRRCLLPFAASQRSFWGSPILAGAQRCSEDRVELGPTVPFGHTDPCPFISLQMLILLTAKVNSDISKRMTLIPFKVNSIPSFSVLRFELRDLQASASLSYVSQLLLTFQIQLSWTLASSPEGLPHYLTEVPLHAKHLIIAAGVY